MYSSAINSALVNSRIDELHRDAQPFARPRIADTVKRCASALAGYLRPATGAPVEKYA